MVNWYCLVNFPDGTQSVHLVPGPAPVRDNPTIKIIDKPGRWVVRRITTRVPTTEYAAEIWVEPVDPEDSQD